MGITVTDSLKFRETENDPWQRLLLQASLDFVYPVGSIYMSVNSTNPGTLFGGTWERLEDTFLLAAGTNHTAGSTGGEETHVLTTSETPAHTHTRGTMEITGSYRTSWGDASGGGIINIGEYSGALKGVHNGNAFFTPASTTSAEVRHLNWIQLTASDGWTGETSSVGSDQAHNNMPPYLAVYMWKRTA